ncbi:glycoside hydrolase domain-containing protein [Parabacteroides timonensis]|uniref:glycoside hydrolase domain-containing protein n=1 Tax=Parabacteroides timonensis TaxID=1871013 RepID=UPI00094E877D|nr:glycoside hydrolase domain-containing protein [Parabacteroides timonensis]
MKQSLLFILLAWLGLSCIQNSPQAPYPYAVAGNPWNEALGNHRAVLSVDNPDEAVMLSFDWRRPDQDVENRRFLIVHAETGDTIPNIRRIAVDNEQCRLVFGPVKAKGTYYFYYLPYRVQPGYGNYHRGYYPEEDAPDPQWSAAFSSAASLPQATVVRVESRTEFDSFYPMEVIATENEKASYREQNPGRFLVFPEDRTFPIRMKAHLPYKWLQDADHSSFKGTAMPNEYYAFQLGVWAGKQPLQSIVYETSGLKSGNNIIPATAITCFNTSGVNPVGKPFTKEVSVDADAVQPLWFGVDLQADQPAGTYKGTIVLIDETGYAVPVGIELKVTGKPLADRGDNEPWRHSRLRWLNSTLGITDKPTVGYTDLSLEANKVSCLGRTVGLDMQTGLPSSIDSWGHELLASPVRFIIRTDAGDKKLNGTLVPSGQSGGKISATWKAEDADLLLTCQGTMEFDGWINYVYSLSPKKDLQIKDIRLEIPMLTDAAPYFMGLGLPGQETPVNYAGGWETQGKTVHDYAVSIPTSKSTSWLWPFDSFWCGSEKAGIHCELRGATYTGPLLNLYRPAYPDSWYNNGKGGFRITRNGNQTIATAYSGERTLKAGENLAFDFALLITPVKEINPRSQFTDRYYHNGGAPTPAQENLDAGIKIINVHHANALNPFINYPFITADKIKDFVDEWHGKDCKVKIYYTIRELTNVVPEIWALRSLGDEILQGGNGGGFPWCQEHYVTGYTPQWYQHLDDQDLGIAADASVLTATGDSRWYNYYVEGLAWLVKHTDIDGLYLDDVAFGRDMLKRMRHAMDDVKPGCIIDLHSNTGFSRGPATQYAEYFPYVDKVWFGESFMYDEMSPANWLVEVSGIPFGLMGDMLHGGGNKWLGMQYGMTVRQPWVTEGVSCDPRYIWQLWDDFNIMDAQMVGFWEDTPAVTTSDKDVKVTAYVNKGKTLLSIGNYSGTKKQVKLAIDWKQLGLDPSSVRMVAPAVTDFQEAQEFAPGDPIPVDPKRGWLIVVSE